MAKSPITSYSDSAKIKLFFTIQFDNYCVPIKTQKLQATDDSAYIQISQKPINQNTIFPSALGDSQKFPYFHLFLLSAKPTNHTWEIHGCYVIWVSLSETKWVSQIRVGIQYERTSSPWIPPYVLHPPDNYNSRSVWNQCTIYQLCLLTQHEHLFIN